MTLSFQCDKINSGIPGGVLQRAPSAVPEYFPVITSNRPYSRTTFSGVSEMEYKIELHSHTYPVSECGCLSPEQLILCYKKAGYDAVNLTNHFHRKYVGDKTDDEAVSFYLKDFEEAKKAGQKVGIRVYLGAEFRFDGAHNDYLIEGASAELLRECIKLFGGSYKDLYDTVHAHNAAVFQAHPFRPEQFTAPTEYLDGIEIYNMHPGQQSRNELAIAFAKEHGLRAISGSDTHEFWHVGRGGIITDRLPENGTELKDILLSGNYRLIHRPDYNFEEEESDFIKQIQ